MCDGMKLDCISRIEKSRYPINRVGYPYVPSP